MSPACGVYVPAATSARVYALPHEMNWFRPETVNECFGTTSVATPALKAHHETNIAHHMSCRPYHLPYSVQFALPDTSPESCDVLPPS